MASCLLACTSVALVFWIFGFMTILDEFGLSETFFACVSVIFRASLSLGRRVVVFEQSGWIGLVFSL